MSRLLQQGKGILSSLTPLKDRLHTTSDHGEVRYNKDLLPSPPGKAYNPPFDIPEN
jgi:NCS1 family nucleobase:cation symporter-1